MTVIYGITIFLQEGTKSSDIYMSLTKSCDVPFGPQLMNKRKSLTKVKDISNFDALVLSGERQLLLYLTSQGQGEVTHIKQHSNSLQHGKSLIDTSTVQFTIFILH